MLVNLETGQQKVLGEGKYMLEDISPDGLFLLMSSGTYLYVTDLDGNNPVLIGSNFLDTIEIAAFWMQSGEIAFIGKEGSREYIFLVNPNGSELRPITEVGMKPYRLLPSKNEVGVLWEEGISRPSGDHSSEGIRWTTVEGETVIELDNAVLFADVSPMGSGIVYMDTSMIETEPGVYRGDINLMVLDMNTLEAKEIPFPYLNANSPVFLVTWTPDGLHLMLVPTICEAAEDNSFSCGGHQPIMIDLNGDVVVNFPQASGYYYFPWSWSPDGQQLILTSYSYSHNRKRDSAILNYYDIISQSVEKSKIWLDNKIHVKRMIWVPGNTHPSIIAPSTPKIACEGDQLPLERFLYIFADEWFDLTEYSSINWYVGNRKLEKIELINQNTGEILRENVFVFDAPNGAYAASIVIEGEIVEFHGIAWIECSSSPDGWSIRLDESVPPGVGRIIGTNDSLSRFTWELPNGVVEYFHVGKSTTTYKEP